MNEEEQFHGQIDKVSKQNGDRDLQQMFCLKIPAENGKLNQNQKQTEGDCELP